MGWKKADMIKAPTCCYPLDFGGVGFIGQMSGLGQSEGRLAAIEGGAVVEGEGGGPDGGAHGGRSGEGVGQNPTRLS